MPELNSVSSLFSDMLGPMSTAEGQLQADRELGKALQTGSAATLFAPERARRLQKSVGGLVGADTRTPQERQLEAMQKATQGVKFNNLESMKATRERLAAENAPLEVLERFDMAIKKLEEESAQTVAERNRINSAASWLAEKDPELASAVSAGVIEPAEAIKAYTETSGKTTVLKEGEVLLDAQGNIIAERAPKPNEKYEILTDAEAKEMGLNVSGGQKYKRNTANNNIVSVSGSSFANMAPPPSGYRYISTLDENGAEELRAVPIEGTPQAKELENATKAVQAGVRNKGFIAGIVTDTIDEAIEVADNPDNWATGAKGAAVELVGRMTGGVASAGSSRKALETKLLTVKSNIGFDRLQKMREESPTGGALGQVAVQELNALQAGLGSLDPNLDSDELIANLNDVKKQYASTASALANAYTDAQLEEFGLSELIPYRTKNPDGTPLKDPDDKSKEGEFDLKALPKEVQDTWEFMSDEDKKLFGWKG